MSEVLKVCLPVLGATAIPVLAGRLARRHLGTKGRLIAVAVLLTLCAALGVDGALGTSADVPASQAVQAGLIAGVGVGLIPLGFFYSIGYGLRSRAATAVAWFVGSLPVATYGFIVLWMLVAAEHCAPGAYECPV